jgi:peptidoglycan hydrolase CwlO-like protein
MDIEIKQFQYRSICDIRRCNNRSELTIGVPGESPATNFNVCRDHLKQIVEKGAELFGLQFATDDLIKQLEAKDLEIEQLHKKLDEAGGNTNLQAEIDRLNLEIEASGTEIKRLENALAQNKPAAVTESKGKGGKKA